MVEHTAAPAQPLCFSLIHNLQENGGHFCTRDLKARYFGHKISKAQLNRDQLSPLTLTARRVGRSFPLPGASLRWINASCGRI
jgi:hypothetical protein